MLTGDSQLPLYVDLDGTLLKTDVLLESIVLLLKRNPLYGFLLPVWLLRGRARLKHELARRVQVACELLPLNPELLAFLRQEKDRGRRLVLISASNEAAVRAVGAHLDLFDLCLGSDADLNLRAEAKLASIRRLQPEGGFAYAGNSRADLVIWAAATQLYLVNCHPRLVERLVPRANAITQFDQPEPGLRRFIEACRPHQWLKNGLVFLPLLLSHQLNDLGLLLAACIGFISFSLCASSVYLLNDLLDLESDRLHATKQRRPFAAGELSLAVGLLGSPALLVASILVALLLPLAFLQILLAYWLLTCLYSFVLKRVFLLDALILSLLYTLRIIAGSAAIGVVTTNWLLGFSACLFFGLALLKRYTEVSKLLAQGKSAIAGRGYTAASLQGVMLAGAVSSLLAVIVFAFYINAPDITELYSRPGLLWLICPLLLYLLWRIWSFAREGRLQEDPLLFAASDHRSQFITGLCALIIWAAI